MNELFTLHVPAWELLFRGTCIYWFLFLIFRFVLRRDSGSLGLADILMVVLIADAAQNGMAGEYKTLGEAFTLIGTIVGWNALIDFLSFKFRWFARFAEPSAVVLVRNGQILKMNMRRQMLTMDELESQMRAAGIDDIDQVKKATFEPDGSISIVPKNHSNGTANVERSKHKRPGA